MLYNNQDYTPYNFTKRAAVIQGLRVTLNCPVKNPLTNWKKKSNIILRKILFHYFNTFLFISIYFISFHEILVLYFFHEVNAENKKYELLLTQTVESIEEINLAEGSRNWAYRRTRVLVYYYIWEQDEEISRHSLWFLYNLTCFYHLL